MSRERRKGRRAPATTRKKNNGLTLLHWGVVWCSYFGQVIGGHSAKCAGRVRGVHSHKGDNILVAKIYRVKIFAWYCWVHLHQQTVNTVNLSCPSRIYCYSPIGGAVSFSWGWTVWLGRSIRKKVLELVASGQVTLLNSSQHWHKRPKANMIHAYIFLFSSSTHHIKLDNM